MDKRTGGLEKDGIQRIREVHRLKAALRPEARFACLITGEVDLWQYFLFLSRLCQIITYASLLQSKQNYEAKEV